MCPTKPGKEGQLKKIGTCPKFGYFFVRKTSSVQGSTYPYLAQNRLGKLEKVRCAAKRRNISFESFKVGSVCEEEVPICGCCGE